MSTVPTHRDRVHGLLAGTAAGDGLGAPFEGRARVPAAALALWVASDQVLEHTDDTAMTLVLADHLGRNGRVDQDELASEFAVAWREEPMRGYGRGAAHVLAEIADGIDWREASTAVFHGGSWGNGAAMRVAPVAAVAAGPAEAAELGRGTAEVTHAHEHGRHGAALQAAAAHLALHSAPDAPLAAPAFLDELARVVPPGPWQEKLLAVRALLDRDAAPEEAAAVLGNDISALGSVPLAVFAFLAHADRPEPAIRSAISCGGDTDTVAAMTGALAGARRGHAGLPASWTARLEAGGRIEGLAVRLAEIAHRARGRG